MRIALTRAVAVGVAALVPAAPAVAQNGVHYDPGSPNGKEYAIPLDQARGNSPGTESTQGGGDSASRPRGPALFGEGITRGKKPEAGGRSGKRAGKRPRSESAARLSARTGSAGGSPALAGGGIAVAVLLAGGGLGLLLRRALR